LELDTVDNSEQKYEKKIIEKTLGIKWTIRVLNTGYWGVLVEP